MKTVFVSGCFDIVHPGHIALLEFAKKQGDRLIVGLNSDMSVRRLKGPNRPLLPIEQRRRVVEALKVVDSTTWFSDDTPEFIIGGLCPDVIVMGREHWEAVKDKPYADRVILFDRTDEPLHSTTMILDKVNRTYRRDG